MPPASRNEVEIPFRRGSGEEEKGELAEACYRGVAYGLARVAKAGGMLGRSLARHNS